MNDWLGDLALQKAGDVFAVRNVFTVADVMTMSELDFASFQ
jgi:hypothetical protein